MKSLSVIEIVVFMLTIIGGLNWGLVGTFNFDLVAALFGHMSTMSRAVYGLVGASSIWSLIIILRFLREI